MSKTGLETGESQNLEELIALGLYRHKKEKILKMIDRIIDKKEGEKKSIEEIRESLSKIDESMSDYIISERE